MDKYILWLFLLGVVIILFLIYHRLKYSQTHDIVYLFLEHKRDFNRALTDYLNVMIDIRKYGDEDDPDLAIDLPFNQAIVAQAYDIWYSFLNYACLEFFNGHINKRIFYNCIAPQILLILEDKTIKEFAEDAAQIDLDTLVDRWYYIVEAYVKIDKHYKGRRKPYYEPSPVSETNTVEDTCEPICND